MITEEFINFCESWFQKADSYSLKSLQGSFDRFFTLFVVYNKLYSESAIQLARQGIIQGNAESYLPDRQSATEYLLKFLTSTEIVEAISDNNSGTEALKKIINIIDRHQFNIILRGSFGEAQREKDIELLHKLRSEDPNQVAFAVLQFLYAIRCNLFHGHKSYDNNQLDIVVPASILLEIIARELFSKIKK